MSDIVYAKTRGNPFFVKTLIRVLYETRLLALERRQWTWNLPAIRQLDVSENVAEFLAQSIQNLPRAIRQSLQYAACIGNRFDLHIAEVEDNGTGILPEHLDHIFEPFFTTKSAEKGTGLGLSIISAIVQNHGGDISCASTPGKGTAFQVVLPAIAQE